MTKDKRSGGGSGEVQSTKVDSPDAPARKTADPAKGAEFSGVEATGPTAQEITAKVDPASGVVYPETTEGGIQYGEIEGSPRMTVDPASLPKTDPACADVVKGLGGDRKRFRVTFNPPSPVGDRAKLFECEATDAADALAQWRTFTGFGGETAVPPVVAEVTE